MKSPTDKQMLDWLADCTVKQGDDVFSEQFRMIEELRFTKATALRRAIKHQMRLEDAS